MVKIISKDYKARSVTVELDWYELGTIINDMERSAGIALSNGDLRAATTWVDRAQELNRVKEELMSHIWTPSN